ncbi:MAG: TonB-dependent receptor, partial [Flavobacteriales bacterium]
MLPLILATAVVNGQCVVTVQSEGQPLPGAIVLGNGAPLGLTGASGEFSWATPPEGGTFNLQIRALGHLTLDTVARCGGNGRIEVNLEPESILLGGATVVGSLSPLRMKDSPIRTQVLSGASLRRIPADDATEAIDFTNGVRETVGCGVCGTNTLQINGLEGVYTLVLLDGVPLLGGLASAYALDGIPLGMIQQVEVIQGPASARFGSQAVGGVINIVLAPIRPGHGRASATLDTHGRLLVSANSAFGSDEAPWQLGADVQRFTNRIDDNGDGYTDAPTVERGVLTLRKQHRSEQRRWRTTLRTLAEERFGGALDFREADRGLDTRYGERIDLLRIEGVTGSSPLDGQGWRFQGGAAYHRQQSTYGTTNFNAEEWTTN